MLGNDINKKYLEIVRNKKEDYYRDYIDSKEKVMNSSAIYEGKPVPFLYNPMFFTEKDINTFNNLTDTLMTILNKVISKYIESKEYRKKFGYSKELEELILIDHKYKISVPIARFDIFYDDEENFKFCELNADGTSAMNETNVLEKILLQSKAIKEIEKEYKLDYFELVNRWVDESIDIYKEWSNGDKPTNIAIVDFKGAKTSNEFEEFKEAYVRKGYKAEIVDPRDFKYLNGKLYYGDTKIDLIYRRLVTTDLMSKIDEIPDFINGYKNQAACFVGPIRSQIIHNKIIFSILHDKDTLSFLTAGERKFIKEHIPYTMELTEELHREVILNKDKYVLKPKDLYASKGVYIGIDNSKEEWERKLNKCIGEEYLVQEFVLPYTKPMIDFNQDGESRIFDFKHIIGLYMYREKFVGMYTRVNDDNNISSLYDCYTVPNIIVQERREAKD